MKAILPKIVKVGGIKYNVRFPYKFVNDIGCTGLFVPHVEEIRISPSYKGSDRPPLKIVETFIHELLHAIDYHYCGCSIEHSVIHLMDKLWLQILSDNKFVLKDMKTLPKKVKVGGLVYNIVFPHGFRDDENACISTSFEELKIYISSRDSSCNFSLNFMKSLFMEGIVATTLYACNAGSEDGYECRLINQLGKGIFQVLMDNNIEYFVRCCKDSE